MEYIKRFRDIALDCYDHCEERTLVEMCMTNMIWEYRAVLENLEISQFAQLLQKAKKTTQSVKPSSDKRNTLQAMAVSTGERRSKNRREGIRHAPAHTVYPKGTGCAAR